jgi:hypothetical protein
MMPLSPPEDVRKMFFEKAHESEFGFVLSFLILYLDIAAFVITGKNLLSFRFSYIEQSIPIGKMIVALLPFFLILPLLSKVRFRLRMWRRMEFRDDTDRVYIGEIWLYAARKNEKVRYDLALSKWENIGNRERRETLIFSPVFWQ